MKWKWRIEFFDERGPSNIIETNTSVDAFFRQKRVRRDTLRSTKIVITNLQPEQEGQA